MTDKLLPCPFCGSEPRLDKSRITEGYSIHCPSCDACGGWTEGNSVDQTIAAWNTRTRSTLVPVLVEALRKIAEGSLGDIPWQASYIGLRNIASAALKQAQESQE